MRNKALKHQLPARLNPFILILKAVVAQEYAKTSDSGDSFFWVIPVALIFVALGALALYCFLSRKRNFEFLPTVQEPNNSGISQGTQQ